MPNSYVRANPEGFINASVSPFGELELLAPAGNITCLHAAVSAGADAVYLGCENFNARGGADNFTFKTLAQACDYAHLRGVRVYLTLNVEVLPGEEDEVADLIRQAWGCGVDAFIVQDLGVASLVALMIPQAHLHISTQMNTHNAEGVRAAASLGAKRVTLARELTLAEVAHLAEQAHALGMTIETFAHGALCVCYSGQCFMSSLIGGRSANRGACAQACRLPYTLHDERKGALPSKGDRLLSPKDLCTIDMICDLVQAGVDSLKVEGRMKSPEYVSTVVGVYRAVIDRAHIAFKAALDQGAESATAFDAVRTSVSVTKEERRRLTEAFSRGFTSGYLTGNRGNDIMSYQRSNNRGVFVGRVTRSEGRCVLIDSAVDLYEGDVLEFWTNKGHCAVTLDGSCTREKGGYRLDLDARVNKGDRVFRVRDASLTFQDDPLEPRVGVKAHARLHIGEPLRITVEARGVRVEHEGPVVEPARTKAVTAEEVVRHIDRTGSTPFIFTELDADVQDGVGIGFSTIHKARAQALSLFEAALLKSYHNRIPSKPAPADALPAARPGRCTVVALAANPACAREAQRAGAEAIYVSALCLPRGEAWVEGRIDPDAQGAYPPGAIPLLPVIDKPSMNAEADFDPWKAIPEGAPLLVESFGQLHRGRGEGRRVEAGPHIPITNRLTLEAMARWGVARVWLSPELSLKQIAALGKATPVALGLTVVGYQELMVMEHCSLMSQGACDQRCSACTRRRSPHVLEDRKGYRFPVITDLCGRSHLYNAVQLDALHLAEELIQAGISAFMVDATFMSVQETGRAVKRALQARDRAYSGAKALPKAEGCTTGHLFRGLA